MTDINYFSRFCDTNNISFAIFSGEKPDAENRVDAYELRGTGLPVGLRLKRTGEFGNNIIQIMHAIYFARKCGLKYIKIDGFGTLFKQGTHILDDGLIIYIAEENPQTLGAEIYGRFFNAWGAANSFSSLGPAVAFKIVRSEITKLLKSPPVNNSKNKKLHLHIRGGSDQFGDSAALLGVKGKLNNSYIQPPFSYYQFIINNFRHYVDLEVVVVSMDSSNPCLEKTVNYLRDNNIKFKLQMDSFENDLNELLSAEHLAGGFGTFIPVLAMLSENIEEVFYFREYQQRTRLESGDISVRLVKDKCGKYIRRGDWRNTSSQLLEMVEYPLECMEL